MRESTKTSIKIKAIRTKNLEMNNSEGNIKIERETQTENKETIL